MEAIENLISPETQWYKPRSLFRLNSGEKLSDVLVAYRTWGQLNERGDNAVIVCHALTGSADVEAWWPDLLGAGRALDPGSDFIVCANLLGSCYGTTGPTSVNPITGQLWGSDFPEVTVGDMVRLQKDLCEHLGVRRVTLVIGGSLGGMLALEWAVMYPQFVMSLAPIATAARQPAWALGMAEAQRQAITADVCWERGHYKADASPDAGLAAARAMAMMSYRHWDSFSKRFGRERRPDGVHQAASYLQYQGKKFAQRFDAASYVGLTRAMDAFDLANHSGDITSTLGAIEVPTLVVSVTSDLLYPVAEQAFLARHLPHAEHAILSSMHGHDGFLIETRRLNALVRDFRVRNATPPNRTCTV